MRSLFIVLFAALVHGALLNETGKSARHFLSVHTQYCLIFYLIAHVYQLSPFEPVTFRVDSSSLSASADFARKKIFSWVRVFFVSISWICCQLFRASWHGYAFQKAERLEEENGPFSIGKIPCCRREEVGGPALSVPMECENLPF